MTCRRMGSFLVVLAALSSLGLSPTFPAALTGQTVPPHAGHPGAEGARTTRRLAPIAASNIAHIWANDGDDKVTRDELRATTNPNAVHNSVWDGTTVSLFGARNEVAAFNLVLEAPTTKATHVNVSLTSLNGPGGSHITTRSASGNGVFDYVGRNIELFYVRYLEIKGLSTDLFFAGYDYDERHVPERCRRPYGADGEANPGTGWEDRPCHNKLYPDIAVPLELQSPFDIAKGTNQSVWGDITILKTASAGIYTGTISVTENGTLTWQIPIRLRVRDFALPDLPNTRTMVYYSAENINYRYLGEAYPDPGTPLYAQSLALADRHFQLAHRHRISLIDDYSEIEDMDDAWADRLSGQLFTAASGYDGVGVGVGNNVYSIGTYGSWPWQGDTQGDMRANADAWVNWFEGHAFGTPTDYFLYLIDESDDYAQIETWADWINSNPGPGRRLMSMATIDLPTAETNTPALDIPTSWVPLGITDEWQSAADSYHAAPDKRFYLYNGTRPGTGSFATEDEGVALRVLAWAQYKKRIDRWFYWEATYYDNFQGNTGETNVFRQAHTYGDLDTAADPEFGQTGGNYLNGDGVLMYPGTDTRFPADSYGVLGPFASLRMKHWRRGIQDVDYLKLAEVISPTRTTAIVNAMIPKVLWEAGVSDPEDPTWVLTDISWSTDSDAWEAARAELADIIESLSPQVYLPLVRKGTVGSPARSAVNTGGK